MKTRRTMLTRGLLVGVLLALSLAFTAYAAPSDEVLAAAEKGLPDFLAGIGMDDPAQYGFNSADELAAATLGEPYEVFTMTPQALEAYRSGDSLSDLLSTTNMWFFPVMVGDQSRTILTVARMDGQWEAVDIGGLQLPTNLDTAKRQFPDMMAGKTQGDYSTKLVRVFQARTDLIAVESAGGDYLVPLAAPPALGMERLNVYGLDDVVPNLWTVVKAAIATDAIGGGVPGGDEVQGTPIYALGLLGLLLIGGVTTVALRLRRA